MRPFRSRSSCIVVVVGYFFVWFRHIECSFVHAFHRHRHHRRSTSKIVYSCGRRRRRKATHQNAHDQQRFVRCRFHCVYRKKEYEERWLFIIEQTVGLGGMKLMRDFNELKQYFLVSTSDRRNERRYSNYFAVVVSVRFCAIRVRAVARHCDAVRRRRAPVEGRDVWLFV
jgi:hypothetical protein